LGELEELHERHRDGVAFLIVYVREAHPEDGWVLEDNRREQIALADPSSPAERDRLYLVGRDGRIAFQGGEGPFGFKPEELGAAIEVELA
jgi:hypothetical protein